MVKKSSKKDSEPKPLSNVGMSHVQWYIYVTNEGFLSLRDLLVADLQEKDDQVQQLNDYIHYS
jgi:hypothetical protein